jgi:hypothetical protein
MDGWSINNDVVVSSHGWSMDGLSINNDAPYDGCKINPKSGKTIKFERQKEKRAQIESNLQPWLMSNQLLLQLKEGGEQNGSNTHTHKLALCFFCLVESVS